MESNPRPEIYKIPALPLSYKGMLSPLSQDFPFRASVMVVDRLGDSTENRTLVSSVRSWRLVHWPMEPW